MAGPARTRGRPALSGPHTRHRRLWWWGGGIAAAAAGIALATVASRIVGFGRTVVFARTVGATCLGDTYVTANTVPNILFEVVAGGALASVVVPVLAGAISRGDRAQTSRTASALLTWTLLLLVPLALLTIAVSRPLTELLVGGARSGCPRAAEIAVGARMLAVFAPQIVLYGVCMVLTGVLQAHRRFLAPAFAPLVSSAVVIVAYATFAATGQHTDITRLSRTGELLLSVGTTIGVAFLALTVLIPSLRLGLRWRPTLRFPAGIGPRVSRLALAGIGALAAQQLSVALVLRLSHGGANGTLVLYNIAWTVFLLPWAVLAVPIATSAFPELSARADARDHDGYAATTAATTRAIVVVMCAAAAVLIAVAVPVARLLVLRVPGNADTTALAWTLVAFAPGLIGYGLVAHLGRALYALSRWRLPAAAIVTGWVVVMVADLLLVGAVDERWRAAMLAVGNSAGMCVAGGLLLAAAKRAAGRRSLAGTATAGGWALATAVVAGAAGVTSATAWGGTGLAASAGVAALACVVTGAVFAMGMAFMGPARLRAEFRAHLTRLAGRSAPHA